MARESAQVIQANSDATANFVALATPGSLVENPTPATQDPARPVNPSPARAQIPVALPEPNLPALLFLSGRISDREHPQDHPDDSA